MIQEQDDQEIQLDVYYQGTSSQLYAFLYPLTGNTSTIFQQLQLKKVIFNPNTKQFQYKYEPQCSNIDRQKQQFKYVGTPTNSTQNYFYSTYQPQNKALIWRSIDKFIQMRPNHSFEFIEGSTKTQLNVVKSKDQNNVIESEIQKCSLQKLQRNWQVTKQQYIKYLSS